MMEHDETVCPGCGEQAAGHQFCPSCGLRIGSFLAPATPATTSLAEPEPEPELRPEPEAEPEFGAASLAIPHPAPSSPWSAPFAAHVPEESDDEPAGETAETPEPEAVADEAPAPVPHVVAAHESNAIYTRGSSDRRAAVACIAALLFVLVVLMNRGLRR